MALGDIRQVRGKFDATVAPGTGDDSGDGFGVGSPWFDVTADKAYVCLDATVGAAVWTEVTAAGGGGSDIGCNITNTADQSILNNTQTALNFNSENYDTDTMHDTVTNNTRITINTAGKYQIIGRVQMANASGIIQLQIRLNGVTAISSTRIGASSAGDWALETVAVWNLAATDYLELMITHTTGAARSSVGGSIVLPNFIAQKIDAGG